MTNVNETVVRYIAAWNERDPKRRRELVAATWAEDGSYIDAHRHGKVHGAIDAMLATTQAQFAGYRLNLISGIETHNNFVRWRPITPSRARGSDCGHCRNSRRRAQYAAVLVPRTQRRVGAASIIQRLVFAAPST